MQVLDTAISLPPAEYEQFTGAAERERRTFERWMIVSEVEGSTVVVDRRLREQEQGLEVSTRVVVRKVDATEAVAQEQGVRLLQRVTTRECHPFLVDLFFDVREWPGMLNDPQACGIFYARKQLWQRPADGGIQAVGAVTLRLVKPLRILLRRVL
eukprot:CAMPEP_0115843194 /NCGR_PEP_ID=MMETSP0287-20121206/8188_1 /TAXON_ID=412157 /ORGANISM="Chrysochromulina rotalis, Strain UIO044" /LENGTH=154 /DNA_ID=CAMNT_0003296883 /DNA_START=383 /DNA_END=847 /DNA_ORIENTATION=+